MGDPGQLWQPAVEAPRMVLSSADWRPRVNGYTGFVPPGYGEAVELMNSLATTPQASPQVVDLLARLRVRYLVVRTAPVTVGLADLQVMGRSFYDVATSRRILHALPAELVAGSRRAGDALLIELRR